MRVLIVDNNDGVSEALTNGMEEYCGAIVTRADTGADAVLVLQSEPLDLAVIDPGLPDMSGFDLAERAADSNVPVLLVTRHPERQAICKTHDYPWLAKPFSLSKLAVVAEDITSASRDNIARIHQAHARLRTNLERAERLTMEANELSARARVS